MLQQFTISNELLSVDVSRELGKLVQEQVAKMRKSFELGGVVSTDSLKGLSDVVKMTGLNVEFIATPGQFLDAWMMTFEYIGHQGTTWSKFRKPMDSVSKDGYLSVTKVDLKNLKVSGELAKETKFRSNCSEAFFHPANGFTDEEITGIILHELGHAFDMFVTLGDYIYLNYMLSDGIDVLMGNKRNVYNLEVLDHTWMEKNIAPELREEYANKRSPDQCRRAILSTWKKAPRHYLFDNPGSAHKREEQIADLFASRLGYGRAVITALHKIQKIYGINTDMRASWGGTLLSIAIATLFLPFTILWLMTVSGTSDFNFSGRYDNPKERIIKMRMDLINQLKTIKNRSLAGTIQADIDLLDGLLKEYHVGKHLFDYMAELASPQLRQEKRLITHEENLESLLNNDLFVEAYRYKA